VTTAFRPGDQPRIARLTHSPNAPSAGTEITIVATVTNSTNLPFSIVISMQATTGDWFDQKTCSASPCAHTSTFGAGEWKYRATVTDELGRVSVFESNDTHFAVGQPSKQ
jgi:hypothetical protein